MDRSQSPGTEGQIQMQGMRARESGRVWVRREGTRRERWNEDVGMGGMGGMKRDEEGGWGHVDGGGGEG